MLLPSLINSKPDQDINSDRLLRKEKPKKLSQKLLKAAKKRKKITIVAVSTGILVGIIIWAISIYRSHTSSIPPPDDNHDEPLPLYDYKGLQELDLIALTNFLNDAAELTLPHTISLINAAKHNKYWSGSQRTKITDIIFHKKGNSFAYVQGGKKLVVIDLIKNQVTGDTEIKIVKKEDIPDAPFLRLCSYDDEKLLFSDDRRLMQIVREGDELTTQTLYTFDSNLFTPQHAITQIHETEKYIYGYCYYTPRPHEDYPSVFRIDKRQLTHDHTILFTIPVSDPDYASYARYRTAYFVKLCHSNPDYIFVMNFFASGHSESVISLWNIKTGQKIFEKKDIEFCHINDACTSMITLDDDHYTLWAIEYNEGKQVIKVREVQEEDTLLEESEYAYKNHAISPNRKLLVVSFSSKSEQKAGVEIINTATLKVIKSFEHTLQDEAKNEVKRKHAAYFQIPEEQVSTLQDIESIAFSPSSQDIFTLLKTLSGRNHTYIKIDKLQKFLDEDTQPYENDQGDYELSHIFEIGNEGYKKYHFLIGLHGDFILRNDERCFLFLQKTR